MAKHRALAKASALGDLPSQLGALDNMTVAQLSAEYRERYGEPPTTRNRQALQKRLAFRIQEDAQGGLSSDAQAKINALGAELPERWRRRLATQQGASKRPVFSGVTAPPRDPRVPPPGTVLRRTYGGQTHEVTIELAGFGYQGRSFRSLSAVAKLITGTPWNGYAFFGLEEGGAS